MRLRYLLWLPTLLLASAPASGDGPLGLRPIAAGVSSGGQPWHQKARADHGHMTYEVVLPLDGEDAGGYIDGPLGRTALPLNVSRGDGFGANRHEYELDGFVYRTVTRVRVTTTRGVVALRLRKAPASAVRRWPQLRNARFFIRFFGPSERPTRIQALDARGSVVSSQPGISA